MEKRVGFVAKRPWSAVAVMTLLSAWVDPVAASQIRWRSGSTAVMPEERAKLGEQITELARGESQRHIVVQLDRPITANQRLELAAQGVNLLRYLGDNSFFATLSGSGARSMTSGAMRLLTAVRDIELDWKVHPAVAGERVPSFAVTGETATGARLVAVYVLLHADVPLLPTGMATIERHGGLVMDTLVSINGLVAELPLSAVAALASEDIVQWIEWPLPPMDEINDSNRAITEADIVQAAPYGLSGAGVTALIYDGGRARATHTDFEGRLVVGSSDTSIVSNHATHVSCTVGGAGVTDSTYRGMAPGVNLVSYGFEYDATGTFLYSNPGDIEADYGEAIQIYGADLSNNSIGTNTERNGFDCEIQGDYGVTSALIDAIVGGSLGAPFRIVWANGNERNSSRCNVEGYGEYYSTAPPAGAKNHITVGALNSNDDSMTTFSSWGPVDDGRMKPDISAPGCQSTGDSGVTSCSSSGDTSYVTMCGTSMAAPTVTGLASLLLEDFRTQFPGEADFCNSTLKVLLAHNAEDRGNVGPDHQFGYGSVRIQQTVDFMRTGNFLEDEVGQAETFSVRALVSVGDSQLKVTLAWDDVPGTPNVVPSLVNDLDLRVFDPSSVEHFPWTLDPNDPGAPAVQTQADHVNNIEQALVENPAAGVWRIDVVGYNTPQGPQVFSLAASPQLIPCSSTGSVSFKQAPYACESTTEVMVNDCDLNTDNSLVETVTVIVSSTSEPDGESVLLTETTAESAEFSAMLPLSEVDAEGTLLVAHTDVVTLTYIDADDGLGDTDAPVSTTATIDCVAPVISSVQASSILARRATITFATDELATGIVHYGLKCGSLGFSATGAARQTEHSIRLSDLTDNTSYYYTVEATDVASNTEVDDNGGTCYSFTTRELPDYFTEVFGSDNDLAYTSITFTPNGSIDYYAACSAAIGELPVDPEGGTSLWVIDDSWVGIEVSGDPVSLYGTRYSMFYVGSNGYITFTAPDNEYSETLTNHFDLPRISALFDDFNPESAGTVSWKETDDAEVITWQEVPQYDTEDANTFQVQMRFDGTLVLSYLALAATDGIVGLSNGGGTPLEFLESDLSAYSCSGGTSVNGIQDQGEERIDCGGPCSPFE